jgi:hypothetical protein
MAAPSPESQCILVLPTTHHTLLAEEILQSVNIRYLSVPKPHKAVSDCGMAIQIGARDVARASEALKKERLAVKVFIKRNTGEIECFED